MDVQAVKAARAAYDEAAGAADTIRRWKSERAQRAVQDAYKAWNEAEAHASEVETAADEEYTATMRQLSDELDRALEAATATAADPTASGSAGELGSPSEPSPSSGSAPAGGEVAGGSAAG